jgi:hypothetical protein
MLREREHVMAMKRLGLDVGTKNIVLSYRLDNKVQYVREINGFYKMPVENQYAKSMLKQLGVPFIASEDGKHLIALGEQAERIAVTFGGYLRRPMEKGTLSVTEKEAMNIMAVIIRSIVGDLEEDAVLYYCIPADAINSKTNSAYHGKIVQAILDGYKSSSGKVLKSFPINEARALVFSQIPSKTGVGISCLLPGTNIYANGTMKNIEDVVVGDMVLSKNGEWNRVLNVIQSKRDENCLKISSGGLSASVTKDHKIYTYRGNGWEWVEAQELRVGDVMGEPIVNSHKRGKMGGRSNVGGMSTNVISKIEEINYSGDVYDLTVENDHSFSGPGITYHNCGAGMVNVSYCLLGMPIYEFSIVGSGDWIDVESARATGNLDVVEGVERPKALVTEAKESIDLTKGIPSDALLRAIHIHYQLLVEKISNGIVKGFLDNQNKAKAPMPMDIIVAGGTASPPGFINLFRDAFKKQDMPFQIGDIKIAKDPLYAVSEGCLNVSEMHEE